MKQKWLRNFSLLSIALLMIACSTNTAVTGSLQISIDAASKGISSNVSLDIDSYVIMGTGPSGVTFTKTVSPASPTALMTDLVSGSWTIDVIGYNTDGIAISSGTQTGIIQDGVVTTLAISTEEITGTGTFAIAVDIATEDVSDELSISVKISNNSTTKMIALAIADDQATGEVELDSGFYDVLMTVSYKGAEYSRKVETTRIVKNGTSSFSYRLTIVEQENMAIKIDVDIVDTPAIALSDASSTVDGVFVHTITAVVSDMEEGYSVSWYLNNTMIEGASALTLTIDNDALEDGTNVVACRVASEDQKVVWMEKLSVEKNVSYTVTFQSNGGTEIAASQVQQDSLLPAVTTPTRRGYAFDGWYREEALTTLWNFPSDIVREDLTLYAKWDAPLFRDMVQVPAGRIEATTAFTGDKGASAKPYDVPAFSVGKYMVTYELWYEVYQWAVTNGYTFAHAGQDGSMGTTGAVPTDARKYQPVTCVSWRDCMVWCNAYSEKSGLTPVYYSDAAYTTPIRTSTASETVTFDQQGTQDNPYKRADANGYLMLTAIQAEYAARGGDPSATAWNYTYPGSNVPMDVAWYNENSDNDTHVVGGKAANTLGLYDMAGNAWQWCEDWNGNYPNRIRLLRGGSWYNSATDLTVGSYALTPYAPNLYSVLNCWTFRLAQMQL